MSQPVPQPKDHGREESDDGGQASQPAKRLRCSSCSDDNKMELLFEEMRNMLQQQNQKLESMFQENQYLREKVSSLTTDISRLDGYLQQSPAPRVLLSDQSCSKPLRLIFLNSCKNDKYSKHKIEADDKTPLKVAIYDHKNEIITSEPFSSMRIRIVPIQGDFDNDHRGQWNEQYFRDKIVSGRPGKEALLFGDLYIRLQDGVGYLNTAKFQDNSSFVASKRFKLGVMAADERISQRIQEGITESFAVKDIRGFSTKKNLYPSPQDPVYKLRRIAKDGDRHKLLEQNDIRTVEEFVLSYNRSPENLRKILGKISDQDWNMVIDHALRCNTRPGNHEHQSISRSDGSRYFEGSSSMQPRSPAPPQELLDVQGKQQPSSSTYTTELSSGVSLEDAPTPREQQVGVQVDKDQTPGAGDEQDVFWEYLSGLFPVIPDSGWGRYRSAFEQSAGGTGTPASGAGTPGSEAGSTSGSLMPAWGARGQECPRLPSSPAGGASSSSYSAFLQGAPTWGADNINNASPGFSSSPAGGASSSNLWAHLPPPI